MNSNSFERELKTLFKMGWKAKKLTGGKRKRRCVDKLLKFCFHMETRGFLTQTSCSESVVSAGGKTPVPLSQYIQLFSITV